MCVVLFFTGCEQIAADRAKALDEVLRADASFKDLISKKERLDSEVMHLKSSYGQKKSKLLAEVAKLRAEVSMQNKELTDKVQGLKSQLEPERQALKAKIKELRLILSSKEKILSNVKAIEKNASNLAEANDASLKKKLDVEDVHKGFSSQSSALKEEVASLKERLRILLFKEKLLRQ